MNTRTLLGVACLALASTFSAQAQTPTAGTPRVAAPGATPVSAAGTGTSLPSAIPPGMVPASATTPTSTSTTGPLYPDGVPTRNVEGGTQRADQPRSGNPAVTGAQPTKRLNKRRTTDRP
ncbi:hypothetical protein GO988_11785 [Hymenobacter sp. HMF4947]|uniref:Proteophosphoglycan ppg4 n=1 Tax=Hymenobacter ginkgonis TaxID=2682976 RepID=A0A7K1TF22_9BACT|nr:hypothetical protein [Hymenobacter ginkgonis]MVN77007.1 hypothetical protein [Hymenobacter ginkgonis]